MNKTGKSIIAVALAASMVLGNTCVSDAAKAKKPTLNKTKATITVGKKLTIKVQKVSPKKTTWSVPKKGKKIVVLSKKKKASVTLKGKKAGKTTLTAKIKVGKKTYTKKVKITVKAEKNIPQATAEAVLPTTAPTMTPVVEPTVAPTVAPVEPTVAPTTEPTVEPTTEPTVEPTTEPTAAPTTEPTAAPTTEPTAAPTTEPTAAPTTEPTAAPTAAPTTEPTAAPTAAPTTEPTAAPTAEPTMAPDMLITPKEEDGMLVYENLDAKKNYVITVDDREIQVSSENLTKLLERTVDMENLYDKWTTTTNEVVKTFAGATVTLIPGETNTATKTVVVEGASARTNGTYTVTVDTKTKDAYWIHVLKATGAKVDVYVTWTDDAVRVNCEYNGTTYGAEVTLDQNKKVSAIGVSRPGEGILVATKNSDGTYTISINKEDAERKEFTIVAKN